MTELESKNVILEAIDHAFSNAKTKQDIIRALSNCQYLHRIPLVPPVVPVEQAQKDFCRERVLLNEVAFVPDKNDSDRAHAFSMTLQMLLQRLTRNSEVYDKEKYFNAQNISDIIMQRACRTSAGSDSFFNVQKLLCIEGTFVSQKTLQDDPPVHIDVFLSMHCEDRSNKSLSSPSSSSKSMHEPDSIPLQTIFEHPSQQELASLASFPSTPTTTISSSTIPPQPTQATSQTTTVTNQPQQPPYDLCSRIQICNSFVIFDVESMDDITGNEKEDPLPWLDIDTIVIDESNFRTGEHWRRLQLIVTCPETGITYCTSEDRNSRPDSWKRFSGRKIIGDFATWLSSSRGGTAVLPKLDDNENTNIPPTNNNNNNNNNNNLNTRQNYHTTNNNVSSQPFHVNIQSNANVSRGTDLSSEISNGTGSRTSFRFW